MEEIQQYREDILQCLLAATDTKGQPRLTEKEARSLLAELSDEQLAEGLLFNTPDDVAEVLLSV